RGAAGVEQRLAHLHIASRSVEPLLGPVVDARSAERAEQEPDAPDHLIVVRLRGDAPRLPEAVVIVDERDEIAAELPAVQRLLPLSLDPIEQRLRARAAEEQVAQRRVAGIRVDAFGEPEIE